jgi:hypothetical protein
VAFRGVGSGRASGFRERFLGARDCGSLAFPCRVLPPGQSVTREQLPPLDTGASLCVSFEDTLGFTRPMFHCGEPPWLPGSSHGILSKTAPPSYSPCASTPGEPGPENATSRARSVLAVPPGFDGLLRTRSRGFVAPRSRPWGPPGFEPMADKTPTPDSPHRRYALRSVSLRGSGSPRQWGTNPPFTEAPTLSPFARPVSEESGVAAASGLSPPKSPLLSTRVATSRKPDAPLGFVMNSGFRRTTGLLPWPPATEVASARHRSVVPAQQPSHASPCGERRGCRNDARLSPCMRPRPPTWVNPGVVGSEEPPPLPGAVTEPGGVATATSPPHGGWTEPSHPKVPAEAERRPAEASS